MYGPETRPIWTNVQDEVFSSVTNTKHTSNHATIWRWREAYQNDFSARIDWSNTSNYKNANHPPVVKLTHEAEFSVKSGTRVKLNASKTFDPDGDNISYNWIYYAEVGTLLRSSFKRDNEQNGITSFSAPEVDKPRTAHFIIEVTDDGEPKLIRYQRVIVTIIP